MEGIYSLAFLLLVSEEISVYLLKGGKPTVCFNFEKLHVNKKRNDNSFL